MMQRPFFEADIESIKQVIVTAAFVKDTIEHGDPTQIPPPFCFMENPKDFAENMLKDAITELEYRN